MLVSINNKLVKVEILRKNNKNLYMRFLNDTTLLVTCNSFVSEKKITSIIEKNQKSLESMLKRKEIESEKEDSFYYLGKKYQIVFSPSTKTTFFEDDFITSKDEKELQKFYAKECIRLFGLELDRILPSFENIPFFTLKIRKMKTRWGVNNQSSKTITLNSDLLKKEYDLIDYVIIHELCHFYEANHGANFWRHVEKYYPKYKEARKRLRG